MQSTVHVYEVRPRKDKRVVTLICNSLPFGRLVWRAECCLECNRLRRILQRSHHAVIRVYDATGNVIETYEHKGDFKER